MVSDVTLAANLTNEGGVEGTIRLLRNVMGLWLVQESRRALWPAGEAPSYEELAALAEAAPAFTAFIDPDDERFLRPGDLPGRVAACCRETGQPVPGDAGTLVRVLLDSLALRYAARGRRADGRVRPSDRGDPRRRRRIEPPPAVPAHRRSDRPPGSGRPGRGHRHRQRGRPGHRRRASWPTSARRASSIARSFPITTYEPGGDWSEARARFAALVTGRASRGPAAHETPGGAVPADAAPTT